MYEIGHRPSSVAFEGQDMVENGLISKLFGASSLVFA